MDCAVVDYQSPFPSESSTSRILIMLDFDDRVSRMSRIRLPMEWLEVDPYRSSAKDLSETIVAVNFLNGAHHSEVIHEWPAVSQTFDLVLWTY